MSQDKPDNTQAVRQTNQSFTVIAMRINGDGKNGRSRPWARTGKKCSVVNGMS